jgi:hypothetical protein
MNAQETLGVIRQVVAAVVAEICPAETPYFPVVWEELLARGLGSAEARKPGFNIGLFYDTPAELKLVSPLVILVVSEVLVELKQRMGPPEKEALRQATISAAKAMRASDGLANALGQRIPGKLMDAFGEALVGRPEPKAGEEPSGPRRGDQRSEYVAWVGSPQTSQPEREEGTRRTLEEKYLPGPGTFEIFVNWPERKVWSSKSAKPIELEPRIRRLLVLFLRHRGCVMYPWQLVPRAWPAASPTVGADVKKMQENLRVAVCNLKTKLECVEGFDIPKKEADGGYYCQGKFSFCILLPREVDDQLALQCLRLGS